MNFRKWDMGSKMIVIATCAAIISFFFKWIDAGYASQNGFSQGAVFFILLFLYPLLMVIREKRMIKMLGYAMAIIGIILAMVYVMSKSVDILGSTFNAASSGPYLFMSSCGLLLLGVYTRRN